MVQRQRKVFREDDTFWRKIGALVQRFQGLLFLLALLVGFADYMGVRFPMGPGATSKRLDRMERQMHFLTTVACIHLLPSERPFASVDIMCPPLDMADTQRSTP